MVPLTFCGAASNLRRLESDARRFMQEAQARASFWHMKLKLARQELLVHQGACGCDEWPHGEGKE